MTGAEPMNAPTASCRVLADAGPMADSVIAEWFAGGGDYGRIAAASDSQFHAVWADARKGRFQLWTATIRIK